MSFSCRVNCLLFFVLPLHPSSCLCASKYSSFFTLMSFCSCLSSSTDSMLSCSTCSCCSSLAAHMLCSSLSVPSSPMITTSCSSSTTDSQVVVECSFSCSFSSFNACMLSFSFCYLSVSSLVFTFTASSACWRAFLSIDFAIISGVGTGTLTEICPSRRVRHFLAPC